MDNDGGGAGLLWMIHGDGPYFIENYRFDTIYVRTARACKHEKIETRKFIIIFYKYDDLNKNFEVNIFSNNMVESSRTAARSCWNRVYY